MNTFGAQTTSYEVLEGVDLTGRRVLVTGASSGLGLGTARVLAEHGAQVVGAVRDVGRARRATEGVANLEFVGLDLASLASVKACAAALVEAGLPLDLVVANAGVMAMPFTRTEDGLEAHLGINHVGHFALIDGLSPLLRAGSRVVVVTSGGHRAADVDLDDPGFERTPYDARAAYGRSKTANILFAVELDRRRRNEGVRAVAVHPGTIDTDLTRHMTPEAKQQSIAQINAARPPGTPEFSYKTVDQGCATVVWAGVVAPAEEVGGRYCEDCHVADVVAIPGARTGVRPYAVDPERAKAAWKLSERLAAVTGTG